MTVLLRWSKRAGGWPIARGGHTLDQAMTAAAVTVYWRRSVFVGKSHNNTLSARGLCLGVRCKRVPAAKGGRAARWRVVCDS